MVNIVCTEDCGNAPRKQLLKELNIAFARHDIGLVSELVADDVVWTLVGDEQVRGKDNFVDMLQQGAGPATELRIHHIITHGNTASVNGILRFDDRSFAFCDVYTFKSAAKTAKIGEITSYVIEVT